MSSITQFSFYMFLVIGVMAGTTACFSGSSARTARLILIAPLAASFLLMTLTRELFSDSLGYENYFTHIREFETPFFEPGYHYYVKLFFEFANWQLFMLSFPAALAAATSFLYSRIRNAPQYPLAVLLLLLWPFFWAYSTTGYRQSLAVSTGLVALAFLARGRLILFAAGVLVAASFHYSALMIAVAGMAALVRGRVRLYVVLWLLSIPAAAMMPGAEFVTNMFSDLDISVYGNYLDSGYGLEYERGLRPDFLLFSALPILLFFLRKPRVLNDERALDSLFCGYLMMNALANLLSFIPYSDRVYSYSWLASPVLIACFWEELPVWTRACVALMLLVLTGAYSTKWMGI